MGPAANRRSHWCSPQGNCLDSFKTQAQSNTASMFWDPATCWFKCMFYFDALTSLRVSWTARRSNQYILKEISPEYFIRRTEAEAEAPISGHLMWRTDSLEKTLMLGKIEGSRRRRWQRMRWLYASPTWCTWVWASSGSWWWTGKPGMLQSMGLQRVGYNWVTELKKKVYIFLYYCLHEQSVSFKKWKLFHTKIVIDGISQYKRRK